MAYDDIKLNSNCRQGQRELVVLADDRVATTTSHGCNKYFREILLERTTLFEGRKIKNFVFTAHFGGEKRTFIFTTVYLGEKIKLYLFSRLFWGEEKTKLNFFLTTLDLWQFMTDNRWKAVRLPPLLLRSTALPTHFLRVFAYIAIDHQTRQKF